MTKDVGRKLIPRKLFYQTILAPGYCILLHLNNFLPYLYYEKYLTYRSWNVVLLSNTTFILLISLHMARFAWTLK